MTDWQSQQAFLYLLYCVLLLIPQVPLLFFLFFFFLIMLCLFSCRMTSWSCCSPWLYIYIYIILWPASILPLTVSLFDMLSVQLWFKESDWLSSLWSLLFYFVSWYICLLFAHSCSFYLANFVDDNCESCLATLLLIDCSLYCSFSLCLHLTPFLGDPFASQLRPSIRQQVLFNSSPPFPPES